LAARSPCIVVDERPGGRREAEDERARNNAASLNPALNAEARLILLAGELAGQVIQADADSGAQKETADSAETTNESPYSSSGSADGTGNSTNRRANSGENRHL